MQNKRIYRVCMINKTTFWVRVVNWFTRDSAGSACEKPAKICSSYFKRCGSCVWHALLCVVVGLLGCFWSWCIVWKCGSSKGKQRSSSLRGSLHFSPSPWVRSSKDPTCPDLTEVILLQSTLALYRGLVRIFNMVIMICGCYCTMVPW